MMRYVVLAFLLSGCAPPTRWLEPPGMSDSMAQQAEDACERKSEEPLFDALAVFNNCMRSKGFREDGVVSTNHR